MMFFKSLSLCEISCISLFLCLNLICVQGKAALDCGTFNFETGNLDDWTRTGTAFDNQPTYGDNTFYRWMGTSRLQGKWWIGTHENRPSRSHQYGASQGDGPQGTLTSPPLRLTGNSISFLIGGGKNMEHERVELLIDGQVTVIEWLNGARVDQHQISVHMMFPFAFCVVKKATSSLNIEWMSRVTWDISSYKGKVARVRLVDTSSGSWGHINFDDLRGDFECAPALMECGVKLVSKRIVGGQHASPGEWRWHVQMHVKTTRRQYCSGSLLTPEWVITAAHCVDRQDAKDIGLTLGELNVNVNSGKEQTYGISRYIKHPQYHFPEFDFALMKLEKPATVNQHVGTICLPQSTQKLPVGTVCWETGWGFTVHNGQMSHYLKELEVIIVDPNKYRRRKITNSEFITTTKTEGYGTCRGDSGGPVVHEREGRWYLEGVHSWGRPACAMKGYYDGQADVRAVLQWIRDTIKNN